MTLTPKNMNKDIEDFSSSIKIQIANTYENNKIVAIFTGLYFLSFSNENYLGLGIEVNYSTFSYSFTVVMWCSTSRRETRSL